MYINKQYNSVLKSLLTGNMIICGGNGGSFDQCMHFCGELLGRFNGEWKSYPVMTMGANNSELTAIANDSSYSEIFIPYINAFKQFDPSFLFISTSGTSKNILRGIDHIKSTYTNYNISLLTGDVDISDAIYDKVNVLQVRSNNTQIIQENHIAILHKLAGDIKSNV
jgi:phosphoheptose isomerase